MLTREELKNYQRLKSKLKMQDMETQTEPIINKSIYIMYPQHVNINTNNQRKNLLKYIDNYHDSCEEDDDKDVDYYYDSGEEDYDSGAEDDESSEEDNDKKYVKKRKLSKIRYDDKDEEYFNSLSVAKQNKIIKEEERIQKINYNSVPLRFMILESQMDDKLKSYAFKKLKTISRMDPSSGEYNKMMNFLDGLSRIPVGKYKNLECTKTSSVEQISKFLDETKDKLDKAVYGHIECKDQIIRLLAQWISNPQSNGLVIGIQGPMGCGKCHAKDTPILMYDGSIKMVQDIDVGDLLMGDDSTPRKVLKLATGRDTLYDIIYPSGCKYRVNIDHILCLKQIKNFIIKKNKSLGYDIILYKINTGSISTTHHHFVSKKEVILFKRTSSQCKNTNVIEMSVKEYLELPHYCQKLLVGYRGTIQGHDKHNDDKSLYNIGRQLGKKLQRIDKEYITMSKRERLSLLAGILDQCAQRLDNSYKLYNLEEEFYKDLSLLCRSIGLILEDNGSTLKIHGVGVEHIPVQVIRHVSQMFQKRNGLEQPITVVKSNVGDFYGFTLDNNNRYMLGDCTVTHNTTLVKEGICKALGLPFGFIPLGGISDGSYLIGHSYTYEGSQWGRIVEILMNCGCMNPILFFDELDKVSDTRYGEEIKNILIHLTDTSQNTCFHDKYYSDLPLDLSRCLIVFSYNNEEFINPILKDRMVTINTNGYNKHNKIEIVEKYMLKELFDKFGFKEGEIIFSKEIILHIISKTSEEKGVRNLKRSLEEVISQINLARLLQKGLKDKKEQITFPYNVQVEDVEKMIHNVSINDSLPMMYI
jgi:hypothetical protein